MIQLQMLKEEKTLDGFTRLFICCLNPWLSRQRGSVKATEYSTFLQDLKKSGSRFEFVGKKGEEANEDRMWARTENSGKYLNSSWLPSFPGTLSNILCSPQGHWRLCLGSSVLVTNTANAGVAVA